MGFRWAHHGRRICRRRADRVARRRNLLSLFLFGWGCSARRRRAGRHALEEERRRNGGGTGTLVCDSIRIRGCRALPPRRLVIVSTFIASSLSAKQSVRVETMWTERQGGRTRLPPSLKEDG